LIQNFIEHTFVNNKLPLRIFNNCSQIKLFGNSSITAFNTKSVYKFELLPLDGMTGVDLADKDLFEDMQKNCES